MVEAWNWGFVGLGGVGRDKRKLGVLREELPGRYPLIFSSSLPDSVCHMIQSAPCAMAQTRPLARYMVYPNREV